MIRMLSSVLMSSLLLFGCQSATVVSDDRAPQAPAAAPEPAAPPPSVPPGIDRDEMVWADEAFLEGAGIKPGKDVIYLPTPPMVVDKMIELANIEPTDVVYDLGTGDGRIAIAAAMKTGCKAVGYEIDPELVAIARENVRKSGVGHLVTIEQQDILELDYSDVDVVLMYLDGDLNVALLPQFRNLKPGARLVSHDWGMRGMIEDDIVIENFVSKEPDFVNLHAIYMWTAPLRFTTAAENRPAH